MSALSLNTAIETLTPTAPLRISRHVFKELDVFVVTLEEGSRRGRGRLLSS
jgi:hypothetical protein